MITRRLKILYNKCGKSRYKAINGEILSVKTVFGGDELVIFDGGEKGRKECVLEAERGESGFAFFAYAVNKEMPVYYPEEGVIVTTSDDERSYGEIESAIKAKGLKTDIGKFESGEETSFSSAEKLPSRRCPTFLSVSGNVNLWEAGFRGFPIEEKQHFDLYDYFIPRQNWDRVNFDADAERVVYRYSFGRGMGARDDLRRRNYKGYYPCLIAELPDGGIDYSVTAFCDSETDYAADCGTNPFNAMLHSAANSLTDEEKTAAKKLESAPTVLRVKLSAANNGETCATAYFRLPQINTPVMAESDKTGEVVSQGYGIYKNRVFMRVTADGEKANGAETAFILAPGEKKDIYILLFFKPVEKSFADKFDETDFEKRLSEAEKVWREKLGDLAELCLPEKRIENAVKTGFFHLLGSCFGERGGNVLASCAGVYPPIGSESSPIIQFLDSVGQNEAAGKCLNFFFGREKEDGFIQNICGYMLENGATLYNESLHYAYSRDKKQLAENFGKIKKATSYVLGWIDRNKNDKPFGYGMIDGQVADPEDTFRSYALNAFAYAGLRGAASVIYKLFLDWNLMDTWGILIQFATPFGILYLMLFGLFSAMSNGYVEAAEIDGAGEFTIFFRICVPMAFGMMSAVMVITAINTWNDYYTSYMYLPSLKTLALGLQELSLTLSQFQRPTLFAAMVITVAPVVILFIAMHDKIISFTAGGGLKG